MNKLHIVTVVGTRPEIIRLSRIIAVLDKNVTHTLVHTGQNYDYELNQIFFDDLEIRKPDYFLDCAGSSPATTIGQVITETDKILASLNPDAILILGDTNSAMAAIPAKRRKIPIFHMEAGNRCFDMRVPEEINRKIVDHISDVNMPYSDIARDYLLREGLAPELIIKTGSPMDEVLSYYRDKINRSDVLSSLGINAGDFFVVSIHREENVDSEKNLFAFCDTIKNISKRYNLPIIISTHPRTRKKLDTLGIKFDDDNIRLMKPLAFSDYVFLQKNAKVVLSDSGTITEESSILNFPALNIRESHERPEGFEEASVMFTGMNCERIMQGIEIASTQSRGESRQFKKVNDYVSPNLSEKVLRIIVSHIDYVNRVVWKKY